MSTTINDLPEEVITEILQYLFHEEVLRLSVINRKWYFASRHPRLLGKLVLWDKCMMNYEKKLRLQKFMEIHPPISNQLPFTEVKVTEFSKTDWQVMEYVEKNDQLVRKLTLTISRNEANLSDHITSEQLCSTVEKLKNLEHLSIGFKCNNVGGCINLHTRDASLLRNSTIRTLEFSNCLHGIKEHLLYLPKFVSNVKLLKLSIKYSEWLLDKDLSHLLKEIEIVVKQIPEMKVELDLSMCGYCPRNDQIRILRNLVDKDIFPKERVTIISIDLQLDIIPYRLLQDFGKMHNDIKRLCLRVERGHGDEAVISEKYKMVANYCKKLETLVLRNPNIPYFLNYFKRCTNLQQLDILHNETDPVDFNQPLHFPKMKFLSLLFSRINWNIESFRYLLLSCTNLEKLFSRHHYRCNRIAFSAESITLIIKNSCPNLRELNLDADLSDFFGNTNYNSGLKTLVLTSCGNFRDHHLQSFELSRLTKLCLMKLEFVSIQGFQQLLLKQCPFIESLTLAYCSCITDDIIEIMSKELKYLKVLDIKEGNRLSEKSINALAKNCKSIKFVSININGIPENDLTYELIRQNVFKVFAPISKTGNLEEIKPHMIDSLKRIKRLQTLRPRKRKPEDQISKPNKRARTH